MKICAVVVTYNRLEELKRCISSLKSQTRKPDSILVINNSSTDGTIKWLEAQEDLDFITQPNLGGAGGFHTGIKIAYEKGSDWIWCLDGDVIPNYDSLEKMILSKVFKENSVGFLSSYITDKNNKVLYLNVPYISSFSEALESLDRINAISVISGSFGSLLLKSLAIQKVGYPYSKFFIWGDDTEYTMRMIRNGYKGYLILESKALHITSTNFANPICNLDLSSRKAYFAIRNTTYIIKYRNKLFRNSIFLGLLGINKFYIENIYNAFISRKWRIIDYLKFTTYVIAGIFFRPEEDE